MAEDVRGLLSRINQPGLKYLTFADPEGGPDDLPAAVETLRAGEIELQTPAAGDRSSGGLLRNYRSTPAKIPTAPQVVPASEAIPLKPLFAHYAQLMRQRALRRA